jgi:hypothetical protein
MSAAWPRMYGRRWPNGFTGPSRHENGPAPSPMMRAPGTGPDRFANGAFGLPPDHPVSTLPVDGTVMANSCCLCRGRFAGYDSWPVSGGRWLAPVAAHDPPQLGDPLISGGGDQAGPHAADPGLQPPRRDQRSRPGRRGGAIGGRRRQGNGRGAWRCWLGHGVAFSEPGTGRWRLAGSLDRGPGRGRPLSPGVFHQSTSERQY